MILVFRQSVSVTRARKTLFEFCWQRHPRTNIKTKNALTPDSISRMQPGEPNRSVRTARTGTCRTFPPRERWQEQVSWLRKIGAKGFQSWRIFWRIDSLSSNNWNMNASATQMGPLGSLDNVQLSSFSNLKSRKVIELHLMGISASQKLVRSSHCFWTTCITASNGTLAVLPAAHHCRRGCHHDGCTPTCVHRAFLGFIPHGLMTTWNFVQCLFACSRVSISFSVCLN